MPNEYTSLLQVISPLNASGAMYAFVPITVLRIASAVSTAAARPELPSIAVPFSVICMFSGLMSWAIITLTTAYTMNDVLVVEIDQCEQEIDCNIP